MKFHYYDIKQFFSEYGMDSVCFQNLYYDLKDYIDFEENIKDGPWIAGGALRRAILRQKANESDVDIFFRDAGYLLEFEEGLKRAQYKLVFETEHSKFFEYMGLEGREDRFCKVNLVFIGFYDNMEQLLDTFDFTICQFVTNISFNTLVCGNTALFDTANKRLRINKITYPNASLRRMIKYGKQGFTACDGTIAGFIKIIREMPEELINTKNFKYID